MITLCDDNRTRLIKAAFEAKEHAYSPYAKFRVGAALLSAAGEVIMGCNVENASYGGTICAERTAIVKAVSEGTRSFIALAVTSDVSQAISPCGMCRQVLREFCAMDMPVLLVPGDHFTVGCSKTRVKILTIGELLPESFGPEQLLLPRVCADLA